MFNNPYYVALLVEGVGRNVLSVLDPARFLGSPSSWRAWVEIKPVSEGVEGVDGRPPRGGRG